MDDIPLDDAPARTRADQLHAYATAPPHPASFSANGAAAAPQRDDLWAALGADDFNAPVATGAASANPFDAFDVFAATTSSSSMSLPPPLSVATTTTSTARNIVALGSPLISFSPVAMSAAPAPAESEDYGRSSESSATAVDDLLSFSPIAAPSSSSASASSSFLMMDDLFLGAAAPSNATNDMFATTSGSATTSIASSSFASSSSSSSSVSSAAASFPFTFGATSVPPPAPLVASTDAVDATTTVRGSFSEFDAAPSGVDVLTDYEAPRSAPAAFNDGTIELNKASQDAVALRESVHETTAALIEAETMAVNSVVESPQREPEIVVPVTETVDYSPKEEDPVYAQVSEPLASPAEQIDVEATCASAEASIEVVTNESAPEASPVQPVVKIAVVSALETEQHIESEAILASQDADDELHHHGDGGFITKTSASDVSSPVGVEVSNHLEPVTVKTTESCEHVELDGGDASKSLQYAVEAQADEEPFPPMCDVAEDGTKGDVVDLDSDTAPLAFPSDIASPSSETHECDGFQALSGGSEGAEEKEDEAGPTFDAEAVTLYAEVTDGGDETIRASTSAPESLLHLQVREFDSLPADSNEHDISSPASVVSSTGSSVTGSAFAFIAAGGTSVFPLGQTTQSPRNEDDASSDNEYSSSQLGDRERDSPENNVPAVAIDTGTRGSDASVPDVVSNWNFEFPGAGVSTQAASVSDAAGDFGEISLSDDGVVSPVNGVTSEATSSGFDGADATKTLDFQSVPESSPPQAKSSDDSFGGFAQTSAVEVKDDEFGGFGQQTSVTKIQDDGFGGFGVTATAEKKDGDFGGFGQSDDFGRFVPSTTAKESDDGFGGFGQSSAADVDVEDDVFGDFGSGAAWESAAFESATSSKEDDDDFDSFTPAPVAQPWGSTTITQQGSESSGSSGWGASVETQTPPPIAAPTDLNEFFSSAFPTCKAPVATSLLPKPSAFHGGSAATISTSSIVEQASALRKVFHASLQDYRSVLAGDNDDPRQQPQQPSFESEALRLKYLKYVLTEKMSEASRHDGVFPQGSEKYQMFEAIAESGHEKNMREALAQLQEALFQSSMNEAVMRIARQAALSAKARIAEQAAQQQAHARGSLLATTRNFLSRSAGSANDKDQAHTSSRTGSGSLGVLTPTSASVQKMSRFPASQNGQDGEAGHSSGYGSGEDTGSDVSVGDISTHSEGESFSGGSGPPSSSSSSVRSGGLMKKFHERFTSLSSTKNRPRTVDLRRMGQSSEEVCKMELNMESINGGFDEVKWRCAGFLYETEEVARVAPSQIKIYSYPANQLLTGKTDRSALSKFFKPGTTWSIDIGVSTE